MTPEHDDPLGTYSVRLPESLKAAADRLAEDLDRSFSWVVRNALAVHLQARQDPPEPLVDWDGMAASGCTGRTYELHVTFALPCEGGGDSLARTARDRATIELDDFGARDIVTRLVALAPMEADPLRDAQHATS